MKTAQRYKIDLRWSEDDEAYIARVPELDGVVTHGSTLVEAAQMAEEAIALHLESLKAHKEAIPDPVALDKLSGNYPLRMGKERHQDVAIVTSQIGKKLNQYVLDLIDRDLDARFEDRKLTQSVTSGQITFKKKSRQALHKKTASTKKRT